MDLRGGLGEGKGQKLLPHTSLPPPCFQKPELLRSSCWRTEWVRDARREGGFSQTQKRFLEPGKDSKVSGFWSSRDPCPVTDSYDPREDGDHKVPSPTKDPQSAKVVLKELRPEDPCTTLGVGGEDPMIV